MSRDRLLLRLWLVNRMVLLPVWIGVSTWRFLSDGRWAWGGLGVVATGILAVGAWRTVQIWLTERRGSNTPSDQLKALLRLRPTQAADS